MLDQLPTRLIEFPQALAPHVLVVIVALGQRLAGDVVPAVDLGPVEGRVVDAAARGVHPAAGDPGQDDLEGCGERDDQVDGDRGVEGGGLRGGAWKPVEDEGCAGEVGGLGRGVGGGEGGGGDEVVIGGGRGGGCRVAGEREARWRG